ncbi:hypothetical protein [Selenomonas sp. AE3005]|uniref:hypothetical protein n=1 Tax=Selenomonas sp. AE3005 TaxID=1485543 RepID=UPI00047F9F41|nr:hypothetical protein [Selenomonas sp. AE3005]
MPYTGQAGYGAFNALADILSTYINKRAVDGAAKMAEQFEKDAEAARQPQYEKPAPIVTEQGAYAKADAMENLRRQGIMPDIDFLHVNGPKQLHYGAQAAFDKVVPNGLQHINYTNGSQDAKTQYNFTQPTQAFGYQPKNAFNLADNQNGNYFPMGTSTPQAGEQSAAPTTESAAEETSPVQKPFNADFAAQKALHPEQFIGNYYVGNNPDDETLKKAYIQKYQEHNQRPNYQNMSVGDMQREFAQRNNPLTGITPQSQEDYVNKSIENYKYRKGMMEHPEWYVGSRYIGDKLTGDEKHDAEVRKEAQVANEIQAAHDREQQGTPAASEFQYKNPIKEQYGANGKIAKAAPSYDEYKHAMKKKRAEVLRQMVSKYGEAAAEKALKMIDSTIEDNLDTYQDSLLDQQLRRTNDKLLARDNKGNVTGRADMSRPANKIAFLTELANYNSMAKRFNKPAYDLAIAKEILSSDNIKTVNIDSGGNIQLIGVPANGGKFDDGSPYQVLGTISKSLSPKDILVSKDKEKDRQSKEKMNHEDNQTKLDVAHINGEYHIRGANIKGATGGKSAIGWRNKLNHLGELAYQSIGEDGIPGTAYSDADDHNVAAYADELHKFMESSEADEDDIRWAKQELERVSGKYQNNLQVYSAQ